MEPDIVYGCSGNTGNAGSDFGKVLRDFPHVETLLEPLPLLPVFPFDPRTACTLHPITLNNANVFGATLPAEGPSTPWLEQVRLGANTGVSPV